MKPYYLIASFPTLILGEPPPLTPEKLVDQCRPLLDAAERAELEGVLEGRVHSLTSDFAQRWHIRDTPIRNAIALARAGRLGVEPAAWLRPQEGFDTFAETAVADAFTKPGPLDRELAIDRFRWQFLDEVAFVDPFSFTAVLAYATKLRMALRWAGMKAEAGRGNLKERVEEIEGLPVAAGQA